MKELSTSARYSGKGEVFIVKGLLFLIIYFKTLLFLFTGFFNRARLLCFGGKESETSLQDEMAIGVCLFGSRRRENDGTNNDSLNF